MPGLHPGQDRPGGQAHKESPYRVHAMNLLFFGSKVNGRDSFWNLIFKPISERRL